MNKRINTILLISFFLILFTNSVALGAKKPYVCNWQTGTCYRDTYDDGDYKTLEECQRKCSAASTTTTTKKQGAVDPSGYYICHKCMGGECMTIDSKEPCTTNCSACEKYTCKTCSFGKCESKTFNSPCSNSCEWQSDCSGVQCFKCLGTQCKATSELTPGSCIDECTGPEQCGGSSVPTTEDPFGKESGWYCEHSSGQKYGTCVYKKTLKTTFYTEEACLANCTFCNYCNKQYLGLWGDWHCLKNAKTCRSINDDQCQKDSDCENGTPTPELPPPAIRYACNTTTWQCTESSSGSYSTLSSCQTNCKKPTPSTRYSCNTTTWQCSKDPSGPYTSLSSCQANCKKPTPSTRYSCNTSTGQCYPDASGKYSSSSSCQASCKKSPPPLPSPTCSINKFELPNHVWTGVDYEAKWSTNSDCKWGEITCKLGDKDCGDNETLSGNVTVGSIDHEKSFHITTPGVYTYQLKACYDKDNENTCVTWEDTLGTELDYIEVQAVNLPWWQEIIPVLPDKLQGFLRGLIS
ncbi:MAG: hypothetical protein PHG13_00500 [Candidatus Pacebacteria bacterium]|nr:hypothetical protein [Candidatus Paceibacterota bacterium]MDD5721599.1 hypothetical protein [Candidatus Paceibacterota bacterium]